MTSQLSVYALLFRRIKRGSSYRGNVWKNYLKIHNYAFKDEAQTALFKDPVRTAL